MAAFHEPYNKALDYLSRREYGSTELTQKLEGRGFETGLVAKVLAQLQANNLQCDTRFAESYILSRARRGMGPNKIHKELESKAVPQNIIDTVFEALRSDGFISWDQIVEQQYQKKYRNSQPNNYNEWAKRARFLQGRGFTFEQINKTLGSNDRF